MLHIHTLGVLCPWWVCTGGVGGHPTNTRVCAAPKPETLSALTGRPVLEVGAGGLRRFPTVNWLLGEALCGIFLFWKHKDSGVDSWAPLGGMGLW